MKETAYLIQAALISAWWLGLSSSSTFFTAFQFDGIPPTSFWAFFAPDIILIGGFSVIRAYRSSTTVELIILGAFAYASLYCCNATAITASGYLPTGLMVLGLFYNIFLCFNESLFRNSSTNLTWNVSKTIVQIICIWVLALAVVPYVILNAFGDVFIPNPGTQTFVGSILFVGFSSLGLTSSFFMVRDGNGTPLPLDQTNKLVISGPYAYVRNPMAVAGIGQGIAISIIFHSMPILVYCLLGAIIWHCVVRPIEEQNMIKRFGDPYLRYRERVSCWTPRFRR